MSIEQEAKRLLAAAADLLESEGRWTKHANARDSAGTPVSVLSPYATCWCAGGALYRIQFEQYGARADSKSIGARAFGLLDEVMGIHMVGPWNDGIGRTQAEVVAALRRAAA